MNEGLAIAVSRSYLYIHYRLCYTLDAVFAAKQKKGWINYEEEHDARMEGLRVKYPPNKIWRKIFHANSVQEHYPAGLLRE